MPEPLILRVAIPTPLRSLFDYLPPRGCDPAALQPGMRLQLPFGRRQVVGVLLALADQSSIAPGKLRRAIRVLDEAPLLNAELLALLERAARYYQHPPGEVVFNALPALLRSGQPPQVRGLEHWSISAAGAAQDPAGLPRAPRQAGLLATLQGLGPAGADAALLDSRHDNWRGVMKKLLDKAWVEIEHRSCLPAPAAAAQPGPALNPAQQQAVEAVCASLGRFQPILLEGITGSGKTEVYLRIIQQVLARGEQALVLVPEIGLTPQLLQRFGERLAVPIAVLHSGLNDQERLCAWLAAARQDAPVVLGTRSALFAPLPRAGVVIIDEEHDLSFKQQDGFRYSARDLAILRAQGLNVPVLLGSATPSLESLHNARQQRYLHLQLPQRAGKASLPRFIIQDVRGQKLEHGLSAQLLARMREHLARDGQVLLFLNRRGYAPILMCHACGWHARCPRCDAHLTYHRGEQRLRCHHCASERPVEQQCPECGAGELLHMGLGTERIEAGLHELFGEARILRIDRDTTRRKGAMQDLLEQVHSGAADILLGTQMLAKGHHFPEVSLVAMLDADYGLYSADFRASERMGQLILQVAGRAGRAERPGEVLIQTHHPDHPLLAMLVEHDYPRFADSLLQERAHAELPPFTHLALLRAESVDTSAALGFLQAAREAGAALRPTQLLLLGPLPAPMEKRAGRYRAQLLVQSAQRQALQQFLHHWLPRVEALPGARKVRWSLDVDPQEMF